VSYLDLDHVEFTIQVLKLQYLPDEKVTITMSHLCVCDMDHFMVNIEIQLQQLKHESQNLCTISNQLIKMECKKWDAKLCIGRTMFSVSFGVDYFHK
jgi:hypothetical protein